MDRLYIISYGTIGDFLMQLYFLEQVHVSFPHCRITVIATRKTELLREIGSEHPYVTIVPFSISVLSKEFFRSCMRRSVFVITPTLSVPWFTRAAAYLLTFPRGSIAGFAIHRVTMRFAVRAPFDPAKLFYQNLNFLLEKLGCKTGSEPRPALPKDESVLNELRGLPYIAVAPFAAVPERSLPPERWIRLITELNELYPKMPIILLGAPEDRKTAEGFITESKHGQAHNFCGASFAQTVAGIARAKLFIGIDSGLTHVAGVLQIPSVIVGNLSNPTWLPQYNPNAVILTESKNCLCSGEKNQKCFYEINSVRYFRCMIDVRDETIMEAIARTLSPSVQKTV